MFCRFGATNKFLCKDIYDIKQIKINKHKSFNTILGYKFVDRIPKIYSPKKYFKKSIPTKMKKECFAAMNESSLDHLRQRFFSKVRQRGKLLLLLKLFQAGKRNKEINGSFFYFYIK